MSSVSFQRIWPFSHTSDSFDTPLFLDSKSFTALPERADQLVFMISFVRLSWICTAPLGIGVFIDFVPGALPQAELWLRHSGRNPGFLQARHSISRNALASGSFCSPPSVQDQSSMANKKGALKFRAPRDLNEIEAFATLNSTAAEYACRFRTVYGRSCNCRALFSRHRLQPRNLWPWPRRRASHRVLWRLSHA